MYWSTGLTTTNKLCEQLSYWIVCVYGDWITMELIAACCQVPLVYKKLWNFVRRIKLNTFCHAQWLVWVTLSWQDSGTVITKVFNDYKDCRLAFVFNECQYCGLFIICPLTFCHLNSRMIVLLEYFWKYNVLLRYLYRVLYINIYPIFNFHYLDP